jgi:hypothetical protein
MTPAFGSFLITESFITFLEILLAFWAPKVTFKSSPPPGQTQWRVSGDSWSRLTTFLSADRKHVIIMTNPDGVGCQEDLHARDQWASEK